MSSGLENWGGLTEWGVNRLGQINRMGLRAARAESGEGLEARGLRGKTANDLRTPLHQTESLPTTRPPR